MNDEQRLGSRGRTTRRGLVALCLGLAALAMAAPGPASAKPAYEPDLIEKVDGEFNNIRIRRSPGGVVGMGFIVGRCEFLQSEYDPADPGALPVEYTRYAAVAWLYPPKVGSILEIGLGGGLTAMYAHRTLPQARITAVEIDPNVVTMAKKHFGVVEDARMKLVVADGRKFVAESKDKYDVVFVDAYRGTWVPETLTTVQFFQMVKARLNPGGVVAQNIEPTTLFYDGLIATLRKVFTHVDVYRDPGDSAEWANTVVVAYDGKAKTDAELRAAAQSLQNQYKPRYPLTELAKVRKPATGRLNAKPLTDRFSKANELLNIDKANSKNTPRMRRAQCE
jgi:spermidine synthase